MKPLPIVSVEATFLTAAEGGRVQVPDFALANYMPHLVVQSPDVRQAVIIDNYPTDEYLGARFIQGPKDYRAGQSGQFTLELMYWPQVNYEALRVGATFTIREGHRIIGFGTVLDRTEPTEHEQT